ncbi:hypothetical protein AB2L28_01685 [Kineococcus sp. TBRC 1896]|uniref:Uncharacterized protein n=1 Tax=Kineococcus mangrovi TaxID=1660183 RepID=A0ABV4I158_9ACTN
MSDELGLVTDGGGFAVIGSASDVERFFLSSGLDKLPSKKLDLHRVRAAADIVGGAAEAGENAATNVGRWVKLTEESARMLKTSPLMKGATEGSSRAIAMDGKGGTKHILQIVTRRGAPLANPAGLAAVGAVMSQYAMQAQMDEIHDYLELLDERVADILRRQTDAVLADMIGVDLTIEDALIIREEVGHVSQITWSKVQATSQTLARTQAFALRELDATAETFRRKTDIGDIAKATLEAEPKVREWLAVLARTFQLQEGVSVLELDHVLDVSPAELDRHRAGLLTARENRLERIGRSTTALLKQMDETVRTANARVLTNPFDSPRAVASSNRLATDVRSMRARLGIEGDADFGEAKRWGQAAGEVLERVRTETAGGAVAARRFGSRTYDRATRVFRSPVQDGDRGRPRPGAAAKPTETVIKGATTSAVDTVGTFLRRRRAAGGRVDEPAAEPSDHIEP